MYNHIEELEPIPLFKSGSNLIIKVTFKDRLSDLKLLNEEGF